jgi:hypothetical protein
LLEVTTLIRQLAALQVDARKHKIQIESVLQTARESNVADLQNLQTLHALALKMDASSSLDGGALTSEHQQAVISEIESLQAMIVIGEAGASSNPAPEPEPQVSLVEYFLAQYSVHPLHSKIDVKATTRQYPDALVTHSFKLSNLF